MQSLGKRRMSSSKKKILRLLEVLALGDGVLRAKVLDDFRKSSMEVKKRDEN